MPASFDEFSRALARQPGARAALRALACALLPLLFCTSAPRASAAAAAAEAEPAAPGAERRGRVSAGIPGGFFGTANFFACHDQRDGRRDACLRRCCDMAYPPVFRRLPDVGTVDINKIKRGVCRRTAETVRGSQH